MFGSLNRSLARPSCANSSGSSCAVLSHQSMYCLAAGCAEFQTASVAWFGLTLGFSMSLPSARLPPSEKTSGSC